jgi:DNA-binding transcriptional ArsR family regulator
MAKLIGFNLFFDGLVERDPRLSPHAVAVWGWLWRCERGGLARCSVRKLAHRLGVNKDTAAAKLAELRDAGYLDLVRRGTAAATATVYRVRPAPRGGPDRPAGPDGTVRSPRT